MLISVSKLCNTTLCHTLTCYPQKNPLLAELYMFFLIPFNMLQACLLPAPKGTSCANYARCVNQILQGSNNMQVPLYAEVLCLVYLSFLHECHFLQSYIYSFFNFVMQLWLRLPLVKPDDDSMDAKSVALVSKYVQWCCGGLCSIYTFYSDLGFLSNCWILKFWFLSSTRHNTQDLYGVCPWCFFFFFSMLYVLMIKLLRVGWLGHEILGSF